MKTELITLLTGVKDKSILFKEVIEFIETYYQHQPTAFKNGNTYNEATQNQGSARVLAFGKLNGLSEDDTLLLFAEHYRSVLAAPDATDHQNIKQLMLCGLQGVVFEGNPLTPKTKL